VFVEKRCHALVKEGEGQCQRIELPVPRSGKWSHIDEVGRETSNGLSVGRLDLHSHDIREFTVSGGDHGKRWCQWSMIKLLLG